MKNIKKQYIFERYDKKLKKVAKIRIFSIFKM